MDFKIFSAPSTINCKLMTTGTATVIEKGDMVALSSGVVIKAVAASTAVGYAMADSIAGDLTTLVCTDPDVIYAGTGDANFAVTMKWTEVDLVGTTTQLVDVWASATDVFKIIAGEKAGTVWATTDILFRINKTL